MTAALVEEVMSSEERQAREVLERWGVTQSHLADIRDSETHTYASIQDEIWRRADEHGCRPSALVDILYQSPRKRARSSRTGMDEIIARR